MKDLKSSRIVFLGAGNMAEALVKGLLKAGLAMPSQIAVTDVREERRRFFSETFAVQGLAGNREAVVTADIVVLAVKPQQMRDVLSAIRGSLQPSALVVSIAAGLRTAAIEAGLGGGCVVRVMPNTPALVGAGVSALCGGAGCTAADLTLAEELLGAVGAVVRVREEDMDAVTAVSGSGPAYVFYLMEAMLAAASRLGLTDEVARQLVYGTVAGAARLVTETGSPPSELRERVTSKGGTTAAALDVMRQRELAEILIDAMAAAHRRSRELSGS
jgi:pyrroline-5-carboxylate reductase